MARRSCLRLQTLFLVGAVAAFCAFTLYVLSLRRGLGKKWPRRPDVLRDLAEEEDVVQLKRAVHAGRERAAGVNASLYEPYLFVAVKSGPARRERRDRLRGMWLAGCRSGDASRAAGKRKPFVTCSFFVGRANDDELRESVADEQHRHGDMVVAPLTEGYARMTAKSLWVLLWFYTNQPHRYIMVTEDDVLVVFSALLPWVGAHAATSRLYTGHHHPAPVVFRCPDPANTDPNCVSKQAFDRNLYPPFAGAFAYLLSRDCALMAAQSALGRVSYPGLPGNVEAAMIGVLLDDNGVGLVDSKAFIDYTLEMCPEITGVADDIMVVGNAPGDILQKLADNIHGKKPLCSNVRVHKWQ